MDSGILNGMAQQIAIRLPEDDLKALDDAVAEGRFPSRAAAVRSSVTLMLRAQREREIAESYRRGYGEQPQEEWVGEAGLALMGEVLAGDEKGRDA